MTRNAAEAAFARGGFYTEEVNYEPTTGLTKREHFAGMAMQTLCRSYEAPKLAAEHAVKFADALLAELEKRRE